MAEWTTKKVRRLVQESLTVADRGDVGDRFDAWLAAHDAEAKAAAWDEGKATAVNAHPSWWRTLTNPYRSEADHA